MIGDFQIPATRDEAVALAQRAAVGAFRAFTLYVVTPAAAVGALFKTFALSYIPSYVSNVVVVDTQTRVPQARHVYRASDYYFSWHRSHHTTTYLADAENYYAITVWDSGAEPPGYRSYFLNANHLCRALGIRSVGNWWALSDFGIVTQLRAYVASMRAASMGMYEISVDNKYLLSEISDYQKSLELPKNVSAKALVGLLAYLLPGSVKLPTAAAAATATATAAAASEPPAAAAKPEPRAAAEPEPRASADSDAPIPKDRAIRLSFGSEVDLCEAGDGARHVLTSHPLSNPATSPEITPEPEQAPPASAATAPTASAAPGDDFIYEVIVMNYELEEYSCRNGEPLLAL